MRISHGDLRETAIRRVRNRLDLLAPARLHMLSLVGVTGLAGFLASFGLLHAGMRSMAVRYPLAVLIAYVVYLALLRLWLARFRLRAPAARDASSLDLGHIDILQVPWHDLWSSPSRATPDFGGGGGFAGGGASRDFDVAGAVVASKAPGASTSSHGGGGFNIDLDEGALVALIVVAVIAVLVLGVAVYVVWIAPTLFAELILDAGLATGLYRQAKGLQHRPWVVSALRQTVVPALLVAALLAIAGGVMQAVYPDVASIGPFVHRVTQRQPKR